jgi:xyloglucan-specific endo-beta-1,4-glucanase
MGTAAVGAWRGKVAGRRRVGAIGALRPTLVFLALLAACGGGSSTEPSGYPTPVATPTPYASPPAGYDTMSSTESQQIWFDRYVVLNNMWNKTQAPPGYWQQMLYKTGTSRWGSRWYWPADAAHQWYVKSYPSIVCGWQWGLWSNDSGLGVRVGTPVRTRWSVTTTGRGRYNVSYDLWLHEMVHPTSETPTDEIMIWLASVGGVAPAGTKQSAAPEVISGYAWNVYYGPGSTGSWDYIAFQSPTNLESVDLDLREFTDYCVRKGWLSGREYLTSVEAGAEVWDGQDQLDSTEFSVTAP